MQNEIVAHNDLKIRVQEGFFNASDSNELLQTLIETLPWESMKIRMFGVLLALGFLLMRKCYAQR